MFGFDPHLNWKLGNGFFLFGQLALWISQSNLLGFITWQILLWNSQSILLGLSSWANYIMNFTTPFVWYFNGFGRSMSITWAIELRIHGPFSTLILIFEDQSLRWKTRQSFLDWPFCLRLIWLQAKFLICV